MSANNNIINAILNIVRDNMRIVGESTNIHNRPHAMGESLENYIKDAFAGTINSDEQTKLTIYNTVFSYGGGANNPPDAVLSYGDAIEVKKVESVGNLPLNSSYPKSKLHNDDPRISSKCKDIEGGDWKEKDIIYAIGNIKKDTKNLSSLVMVYGDVYCADRECYERLFNTIKEKIASTDYELGKTDELAHINAVDPLGITYFRARGMWGIKHPFKVFDYIYQYDSNNTFEMMVIIPKNKFDSFSNKEELIEEARKNDHLKIQDKQVKDPNNTVKLVDVKLITYKI